MPDTVVALFDDLAAARDTVSDLIGQDFDPADISLLAQDPGGAYARELEREGARPAGPDAASGASLGALVGSLTGLLAGLGALVIPGIGPIVGAGAIASTLVGLGVGAVTGGVLGALVDAGVPEQEAGSYAEAVRRGGTLVILRQPGERFDEAVQVVQAHNPVDVAQRVELWREQGWVDFNPDAPPHPAERVAREREVVQVEREPELAQVEREPDVVLVQPEPDDEYEDEYEDEDREMRRARVYAAEQAPTQDYDDYHAGFRRHYQSNYATQGYPFEQYEPGYRYGYNLATAPSYKGLTWDEVEAEARERWEEQNPGTWALYRETVREAWTMVRER